MTDIHSHTHTAGTKPGTTTGTEDNIRGPRANTDLDRWHVRPFEFPNVDENVEFETRFGISHHGVIVRVAKPASPKSSRHNEPSAILFKSESADPPEYYTVNQVEKWKRALAYPMRRFRGSCLIYGDNDVTPLIALFQAYILERYIDKFKTIHPSIGNHVRLGDVEAWTEANGKSQWINQIGLPDSGVTLVHNEGHEVIDVTVRSINGAVTQRSFNFKQVMECAELVCTLCNPQF